MLYLAISRVEGETLSSKTISRVSIFKVNRITKLNNLEVTRFSIFIFSCFDAYVNWYWYLKNLKVIFRQNLYQELDQHSLGQGYQSRRILFHKIETVTFARAADGQFNDLSRSSVLIKFINMLKFSLNVNNS